MVESRAVRIALRIASGGVLFFLYLPLAVLVIYAFNDSRIQAWPPVSFSLKWFGAAAENPAVVKAVINSLIAGTLATGIALALGTLTALAVHRYRFFGRETISFLFVLPANCTTRSSRSSPASRSSARSRHSASTLA